jgi:muconolactone delta-isomerase
MKFLVRSETIDEIPPQNPRETAARIENVVVPSLETLEKWERDGKIVGGTPPGQRAGVFIIEAPSAEELHKLLARLPIWGVSRTEVTPLVPLSTIKEVAREQANQLKAMAAAMPTR